MDTIKRSLELESYRLIFESSIDGIIISNPEGKVIHANQAACKMLGYSIDELKELTGTEIVDQSDLKAHLAIQKRQTTGHVLAELKFKRKDNSTFPVEASSHIFTSSEGKELVCVIFRDITDKQRIREGLDQALEMISASERRFRGLIQNLSDVIILMDKNWKVLYASPSMEKVTGYTLEERLGTSGLDWIHPDDIPAVMENAKDVLEKKIEKCIEIRAKHKTKGWIWTETIASNFLDDPAINAIVINYRDIDDRKKINEEHQLLESRYRALASNFPNGVVSLFDHNLKYVVIEGEEIKRFGLSKEKMEGKAASEVWPEYVSKIIIPHWQAALKGNHHVFEIQVEGQFFEAHTLPVRNDKGEIILGMGLFENITERKKIEKELNEINESKDKLFSIISHDLRSPFTSLLGLSEYLMTETGNISTDEIIHIASSIHTSAKSLLVLLDNLLQWSRFKTGKIMYTPETFELNELIHQTITTYKSTASKKNIDITFSAEGDYKVFADHYMADTVLRNLLSNAIKFTNRGGRIHIITSLKNDMAKITISDDGVGISEENMHKLFKVGEQISTRGTENEVGTGLGLTLCKEFIDINNGTIDFNSQPDIGTTVSFTLPAV